jgi:hydrogenase maturation protein HypF
VTAANPAASDQTRESIKVHVGGVVQGVGFRPFVYNLALRLGVDGTVRNTSSGVEIEIAGPPDAIEHFLRSLETEAPPLARLETCQTEPWHQPLVEPGFRILPSQRQAVGYQPISPDVATCDACLTELFDPADRRFRYPFINCTHCGPRLTIIESMPYDRPKTTMAGFVMCEACAAEYNDPRDRRFHAQPIACPSCGPSVWLRVDGRTAVRGEEALQEARRRLASGEIVAVKGLGGFHLACNALDESAVQRLRRRKGRGDKPLAVMFADLEAVQGVAQLEAAEAALLAGRERPIVLLARHDGGRLPASLSPGLTTVGALLPYTPLHHLLLERSSGFPTALVMTSGNPSEEPIVVDNAQAEEELRSIADAFLLHDRRIHQRCDDSVLRVFSGATYPVRRSRGFVPNPIRLPVESPPILATGPHQKNTFCLVRDGRAFLGPHIGDLEDARTLEAFSTAIAHFEGLFRVQPELLCCDLHPDYLATRYAEERAAAEGLPLVRVQHHHAHIAACLAEAGASPDEPVIGFAFDGTGYGPDGAVWGGEVLLADLRSARRLGHLAYVAMPGGEAAVRQPWRMALAWLHQAGIPWEDDLPCVSFLSAEARAVVARHLEPDAESVGLIAPMTSSMGRLFDAVASLVGIRQEVRDEGQAAIELEATADPAEDSSYAFDPSRLGYDASPVFEAIVGDLRRGVSRAVIATRFHQAVAGLVREAACQARDLTGVSRVVLSGGVWQNMLLLDRAIRALEQAEFEVQIHRVVPANDGGIALGQAAVAAARWRPGMEA